MRARTRNLSRWGSLIGGCALGLLVSHGCVAVGEEQVGVGGTLVTPADSDINFQAVLSPYGEWVTVAGVGNVWRPYSTVVGADFVPYGTDGRWVYSDWGWTFASDWTWGWLPFHYGRWFFEPAFGWCWAPGTEWAPAWVDWRWGDGFAGWAPLPPLGARVRPAWTFVDRRHFLEPNVGRYRLPPHQATAVFSRTTEVRDYATYGQRRWNRGPERNMVERDTGTRVPRTTLRPPPPGQPFARGHRQETARTPPPGRPAPMATTPPPAHPAPSHPSTAVAPPPPAAHPPPAAPPPPPHGEPGGYGGSGHPPESHPPASHPPASHPPAHSGGGSHHGHR